MNSSGDLNDKSLQKHFREVFDDFECDPSASLTKRVWKNVPASPNRYRRSVSLLLSLLFLVTTAIYYRSYRPLLQAYTSRINQPVHPENTAQTTLPQLQLSLKSESHAEAKKGKTSQLITEEKQSKQLTNVPARHDVSAEPIMAHNVDKSTSKTPIESLASPLVEKRIESSEAGIRYSSRTKRENTRAKRNAWPKSYQTNDFDLNTSVPLAPSADQSLPSAEELPVDNSQQAESAQLNWQPLQVHGLSRPLSQLSTQLHRTVQSVSATAPVEQPMKSHKPFRWLASVAPLSTYQLMTVIAKPDAYVQRVHTPAPLSGPTWGYQVSAGIEWRKATIQLTAGQIRRWAYYELATSTFDIEPVGPNRYQAVQREQAVAENVSLTMLGLKVGKLYTLGHTGSPYFVRLTGEASYVPTTQQSLVWAGASMGAHIPIGRAYNLQVGPTVSYSLNKLWSAQRQIIIHPYLIGFSFTLQPSALSR